MGNIEINRNTKSYEERLSLRYWMQVWLLETDFREWGVQECKKGPDENKRQMAQLISMSLICRNVARRLATRK
jgi:hypothetical protein